MSQGIYDSLNCGNGSDDAPDNVAQNRELVAQYFDQSAAQLISVHQTHSADCLIVNEPLGDERPKADAMVTDKPNLILGILTADCGPILFCGEKSDGSPVIGAAHAGWRGAIGGILHATVRKMEELGAQTQSINAAIGPCIGPASYEVSEDFIVPFIEKDPDNEHFFKAAQRDGHLMFDLPGFIAAELAQSGVKNIEITGHDTFSDEENFFSYRRKTHRNEPDYGRQISAIMIKS